MRLVLTVLVFILAVYVAIVVIGKLPVPKPSLGS